MRKPKGQSYYMHTLNGKPAGFVPGWGICYARYPVLATSLRQIKREQVQSEAIRIRNGYRTEGFVVGHKIVRMPNK